MVKRSRTRIWPLLGAFAAIVALPFTAAADIYQWTDADGVVHFTNKPTANPTASGRR